MNNLTPTEIYAQESLNTAYETDINNRKSTLYFSLLNSYNSEYNNILVRKTQFVGKR